jgi:peptide/nickel transport system permease protein
MPSAALPIRARPARWRRWQRLCRNRGALVGLSVFALIVVIALAAPWLAPADPNLQSIPNRLKPPGTPSFPLGSDHLGRDTLSRLLYGTRVSLLVGLISVLIGGTIGIALGLLSGFYRGAVDDAISWVMNVQLSFPFILLMIAVVAVVGPGLRNLIIVLGIGSWVVYARVLRGQVLSVGQRDFVLAARTVGAGELRLLIRHVLPNAVTPIVVIASFEMARMIVLEASLSFLGLGVETSIPTWGGMLADGRTYVQVAWWLATIPGLAIMLTVLSVNLVGDWIRDELDPKAALLNQG